MIAPSGDGLLGLLALPAATLDAVLITRAAGTPSSGLGTPVGEVARLLQQRHRSRVAADILLRRRQ